MESTTSVDKQFVHGFIEISIKKVLELGFLIAFASTQKRYLKGILSWCCRFRKIVGQDLHCFPFLPFSLQSTEFPFIILHIWILNTCFCGSINKPRTCLRFNIERTTDFSGYNNTSWFQSHGNPYSLHHSAPKEYMCSNLIIITSQGRIRSTWGAFSHAHVLERTKFSRHLTA